jgi:4-hydroxy-2-oxoheptanedioate aldolase
VAGLAGVVIGPGDLALSLGLDPSNWEDEPSHQAMRRTIRLACLQAGIVPGTFTPSPQSALRAVREGFRLVALSTDLGLMLDGARAGVAAVRSATAALAPDITPTD